MVGCDIYFLESLYRLNPAKNEIRRILWTVVTVTIEKTPRVKRKKYIGGLAVVSREKNMYVWVVAF